MDFKNVPKKYRPIPFWSWNEKLDTKETRRQVNLMNDAGIGGYFMHARGGLATEYMGDEWFDNVSAATEEGEKLGMRPWAYDENGWPSGFGNGFVNGKGIEYQQKYLRVENEPIHTETAIAKCGEHYFYYEVNPFYVDTLDKKVIAEFIKYAYEPYYERFGNRVEGFFTDEPQISRNGIPWSFCFEEEFKKRYGLEINEHLEELFFSVGDYKDIRIKFWKMVTDMFSEAYFKQIYDWCSEHGMKLTGHLVNENNLRCQLFSNGACMPHYEYFHIPGMDWLGKDINSEPMIHQLCSAAAQLEKNVILSETFAMCGHNISLANLKGIYEWQMVRGVNLLCQHLEGYTLRGIRKRDYPPAMYYQQPWWSVYKDWVDAMSRIGMIIAETKVKPDVLLLHPETSAWANFDGASWEKVLPIENKFVNTVNALERRHIMFHLGDETLMERHARVEDGCLIIGEQRYSKIIKDGCENLLPTTEKLLSEFISQGGQIITLEDIENNTVVNREDITYSKRFGDGFIMHYFVNTSPDEKSAVITAQGKKLNIYTGDLEDFDGTHTFEPWGSLVIIEDGSQNVAAGNIDYAAVQLKGDFKVNKNTLNSLTLDRCDYYFDGVLQEKNGYVLNIAERANAQGKMIQIHQDYKVNIESKPDTLYLVTECPENFEIKINGEVIDKTVVGIFRDMSFKKIDIVKYVKTGENVISFDCDFVQSPEFYESLRKSFIFESEKNKLSYDMEIEPIYLLGDFGVKTDGKWKEMPLNAYRYTGDFVITELPESINLKNIEQQGFPFFCGELELETEIEIDSENIIIDLNLKGVNAVKVKIGDIEKTVITDNKLVLHNLNKGRYTLKLTLINNLRNLLGPHHLTDGEKAGITPTSFFKEACVWYPKVVEGRWNEDYCFVKFGF